MLIFGYIGDVHAQFLDAQLNEATNEFKLE